MSTERSLPGRRRFERGDRVELNAQVGTVTRVGSGDPSAWIDVRWDGGWSNRLRADTPAYENLRGVLSVWA